jgi:hypothetical protein
MQRNCRSRIGDKKTNCVTQAMKAIESTENGVKLCHNSAGTPERCAGTGIHHIAVADSGPNGRVMVERQRVRSKLMAAGCEGVN